MGGRRRRPDGPPRRPAASRASRSFRCEALPAVRPSRPVMPMARAACAWRRSKVEKDQFRAWRRVSRLRDEARRAMARPSISAMAAADSQVVSSSSTMEKERRSSANAARAAASSRPASRRARLRRTSTIVCRAAQELAIGPQQRVSGGPIGLLHVTLEQGARIDVRAHSPRSSANTSSTRLDDLRPAHRTKRRTRARRDPTGADPIVDARATWYRTEHRLRPAAVGDPQAPPPVPPGPGTRRDAASAPGSRHRSCRHVSTPMYLHPAVRRRGGRRLDVSQAHRAWPVGCTFRLWPA